MATEQFPEYQACRDPSVDRSVLCHAPFAALNFEQNGRVKVCCYNWEAALGTYPDQTLREIWEGLQARQLREAFAHQEPAKGCQVCFNQLRNGNHSGVLMRSYDRWGIGTRHASELSPPWVREMTFEISNICNLECVMCDGRWSSAIRHNREKLPPLENPYDSAFLEQIEDFLPHLSKASFLGGEPFLVGVYGDIWDRLMEVNPQVQISITTNGTILTPRVRRMLDKLRCHIVISIDALERDTYEAIRKNARHEQVMENLQYFLAAKRARGTGVSLAVCPMVRNWKELSGILEFCDRHEMQLHFNTVFRPADVSLGGLPSSELQGVVDELERFEPPAGTPWRDANRFQWKGLTAQLRSWLADKRQVEAAGEAIIRGFALRAGSWNAASLWPLEPERLRTLVTAMAHGRAIERVFLEQGIDLGQEVPRILHGARVDTDDGPVSVEALLRVLHLFARFDGRIDALGETTDQVVQDEQALLGDFIQFLAERTTHGNHWIATLGAWLRYLVEAGRLEEACAWLRWLLVDLKLHRTRAAGTNNPERAAKPSGPDESSRTRSQYRSSEPEADLLAIAHKHLATAFYWTQRPFDPLGLVLKAMESEFTAEREEPKPAALSKRDTRDVSNLEDLARLFDEIRAYQKETDAHRDPAQLARLERRLQAIEERVAKAPDRSRAFALLSAAEFVEISSFLIEAPDEEFQRSLAEHT